MLQNQSLVWRKNIENYFLPVSLICDALKLKKNKQKNTLASFLFRKWTGERSWAVLLFFFHAIPRARFPAHRFLKNASENESQGREATAGCERYELTDLKKFTADKHWRVCAKTVWMHQSFITINIYHLPMMSWLWSANRKNGKKIHIAENRLNKKKLSYKKPILLKSKCMLNTVK